MHNHGDDISSLVQDRIAFECFEIRLLSSRSGEFQELQAHYTKHQQLPFLFILAFLIHFDD